MLVVFFATLAGDRLAGHGDAQGLLSAGGHRPALGLHRGAPGHLVRGHGRRCSSRSRRRIASRRTSPTWPPSSARHRAQRRQACSSSSSRADERPALQTGAGATCAATPRASPASRTVAVPVQNLQIGGRSSKAEYQFVLQGLDRPQLYEWSQKMADAMSARSDFRRRQQRPADQRHAGDAGRRQGQGQLARHHRRRSLRSTLYSGFGSRQVSTIYGTGDSFAVVMEFDRQGQLDHGRAAGRPHPQHRAASSCRSAPSRGSSARPAR